MTIHEDAKAAFEAVYDIELGRLEDLLDITTSERDRALTDISEFRVQLSESSQVIATLTGEISRLEARITELESIPPVGAPTPAGALPLGQAKYPLGNQSVIVWDSPSLQSAINNHRPGDTISMREGTYTTPGFGDSFTKGKGSFILQNYPGEQVRITPGAGSSKGFMIVKSPGVTLRGFQLDGFTGNWGGNYGTLILADDTGDGSSASGATLENMHITNSASFAVRAFGNKTRRLSGVTIRNCTFDGSGAKQILSTDWTDGFTAEKSVIRNVNRAGLAFDNSEMAAWKDTVSTKLRADEILIENAKNSVGIWLDQSCVDFAITNCEIKGKTQYGVHIELCGWGVVANVRVSGDSKFVFYNKGSRNIRYWNNSFEGKADVVFMDEQDDRAGKTSTADPRQPFISRGLDYFSRDNEWVNNSSSSDPATYARMMIYDDQGKSDARMIVSRVSGNLLPGRTEGSSASFSLGVPLRKDFTAASASALDTSKFFGNGVVVSQVQQQSPPADIAKLID